MEAINSNFKMNKMKKNIINSILLATLLFVGCKKNDTRYPFSVELTRVPYVNVVKDVTGSISIDLTNLAAFNGKYNITLLYPNDIKPDKVDVVVRKNNDNTNIKVLQTGITTFPSSFTVTASQLAAAFGTAIKLGDNYDLGSDIYVGDKKYEAFPAAGGIAYGGTGQQNQPGFTPTIRYGAICAFTAANYAGNFKITSDPWGDFGASGLSVIPVTVVNATTLSIISPLNGLPINITVNADNTVTVAKQPYGDYKTTTNAALKDPTFTFGLVSVNNNGSNNFVSPCSQTINLGLQYTVGAGSFGTFPLNLLKQ